MYFHKLDFDVTLHSLPEKFTYPFNYDPHPLALRACEIIKEKYLIPNIWNHDFGMNDGDSGMGKMIGALVVKNDKGEIGFLAAFSGKIGETNLLDGFVPPVFNILELEGFFKKGEEAIVAVNKEVLAIENSEEFENLRLEREFCKKEFELALSEMKSVFAENKKKRKEIRDSLNDNPIEDTEKKEILSTLDQESSIEHYQLKDLKKYWRTKIEKIEVSFLQFENQLILLKKKRKEMSGQLQNRIFSSFAFLNARKEVKDLRDIFNVSSEVIPPSGAGECAAPKLLQFAYLNDYKPICMAEFWWGKTPSSEIRKHEYYYPACKGKCEPILTHMLQGLEVEGDPVLNIKQNLELDIIYEDNDILAINKPHDTLSVPGKKLDVSIYDSLREMLPKATGPLNVHRLDMATSGILLVAKNMEVYHHLQMQFTTRQVTKVYAAILDGIVKEDKGCIELPLRVDLDDRPRQLVCYEHGKHAKTHYKVIGRDEKNTRVLFFPVTGRTHQLRVHASHHDGLNCAIKGDELYGKKGNRLYLHAQSIQFTHPTTKEVIKIECPAPF